MPNHLPTPTPREYCHLSRHRSRQNTAPPRAVRALTQRRHAHGGKRAPALGQVVPLLVTRAGFTDSDALQIYRALFGFLHGHILNELQQIVERPEETDDLLRLGLHRLADPRIPPPARPGTHPGPLRRRLRTRTWPRIQPRVMLEYSGTLLH